MRWENKPFVLRFLVEYERFLWGIVCIFIFLISSCIELVLLIVCNTSQLWTVSSSLEILLRRWNGWAEVFNPSLTCTIFIKFVHFGNDFLYFSISVKLIINCFDKSLIFHPLLHIYSSLQFVASPGRHPVLFCPSIFVEFMVFEWSAIFCWRYSFMKFTKIDFGFDIISGAW